MDAERLLDDVVQVRQVFDGGIVGHTEWDGSVDFGAELLQHTGRADDVEEDSAGGVAGGVGTRDELGEGFGGEFVAP